MNTLIATDEPFEVALSPTTPEPEPDPEPEVPDEATA